MTINDRKKLLFVAENNLAERRTRLKRTMTSIELWERRVKHHTRALQQETEAMIQARTENIVAGNGTARKFR